MCLFAFQHCPEPEFVRFEAFIHICIYTQSLTVSIDTVFQYLVIFQHCCSLPFILVTILPFVIEYHLFYNKSEFYLSRYLNKIKKIGYSRWKKIYKVKNEYNFPTQKVIIIDDWINGFLYHHSCYWLAITMWGTTTTTTTHLVIILNSGFHKTC